MLVAGEENKMRLNKKSISKVTLLDLLRRKQSSLSKYLEENGIVTYERLTSRCASIGVVPPSEEQFKSSMGNPTIHEYSSPTDGIIVLNPSLSDEEIRETQDDQSSESQSTSDSTKKKRRKTTTQSQDPQ